MTFCEWTPNNGPREFADQLAEIQREVIEITTKFTRLGYQLTGLTFKGQVAAFTVIGPSGAVDINFNEQVQKALSKTKEEAIQEAQETEPHQMSHPKHPIITEEWLRTFDEQPDGSFSTTIDPTTGQPFTTDGEDLEVIAVDRENGVITFGTVPKKKPSKKPKRQRKPAK